MRVLSEKSACPKKSQIVLRWSGIFTLQAVIFSFPRRRFSFGMARVMAVPFEPQRFIARQVREIPRSGIREFFELVQGQPDVISLGVGEPDFVTPWHFRERAIYASEKGKTGSHSISGCVTLG